MLKLIASRDLHPIPAVAATAFLALAIFAWTERTILLDPDGMSVPYWPWKLWQIAPLLMGLCGVWWLWFSTQRVPWVRSLALGILALVVLANAYTGLFDDHWGNVWRTVNPLFIGSSTVAAAALWRSGHPAGQVAGVVSAGLGRPRFRQRLLRRQRRPLADARPCADAHRPCLGRRCHLRQHRLREAGLLVVREVPRLQSSIAPDFQNTATHYP